jgi:hypothetical protein
MGNRFFLKARRQQNVSLFVFILLDAALEAVLRVHAGLRLQRFRKRQYQNGLL